MGQIIKTSKAGEVKIKSAVDLKREESPEVGFIYLYKSYHEFIRVTKVIDKCVEYDEYSFEERKWVPNANDRKMGFDTLKEYYVRFVHDDFEKLNDYAERVMNGEDITDEINSIFMNGNIDENTSAIALSGTKETILQYNDKLTAAMDYFHSIQECVEAKIRAKKAQIERYMESMTAMMVTLKKEIEKVMKVVQILEIYVGVNEEIFQITSGKTSEDKTLIIRQLTLYMDEEMADWHDKYERKFYSKGGADYKDIEIFDEWLANPKNRDKVIPEERCIVFFKPRRYRKHYSNDRFENELLNQWNHETYVLLRNGDNLYRLYSKNIQVGEYVFPLQKDIRKLQERMQDKVYENSEWVKEDFERLNFRASKIAVLVNSLCERTQIFDGEKYDMFHMEETNIKIIYDGDPEKLMGTARPSWKEWINDINSNIGEGSRIFFISASVYEYYKNRANDRFLRSYNYDSENIPPLPLEDVYTVYKAEKYGEEVLTIKYMPDTKRWGMYGLEDRKQKSSFIIKPGSDKIINYDRISEEELDYYLTNRIDRKAYEDIMPLLFGLRKRLEDEKESEKDFVKLLANSNKVSEDIVWELLHEWKYKNKWKRALTADDEKAYRMIERKLKKDSTNIVEEL